MPKKLDSDYKRLHMLLTAPLAHAVDEWRRQEPDYPNQSEAIRRLLKLGLTNPAAKRKARPHRDGRISAA